MHVRFVPNWLYLFIKKTHPSSYSHKPPKSPFLRLHVLQDATKTPWTATLFFVHVTSCIVARSALSTTKYSIVFVYCMTCYSLSDVCFAYSCIFRQQLTSAIYKVNVSDVTETPGGCNMDTSSFRCGMPC